MLVTGADLAAKRKAAGMNQTQLADKAGIARCTVSYWENKPFANPRGWAVRNMLEALGEPVLKVFPLSVRARASMGLYFDFQQARLEQQVEQKLIETQERKAARDARKRVICGAKTRKGTPCRMRSEPGRKRCKFHGGKSTGPKTEAGKSRIAEAQRKRWAEYRARASQSFPA